MPKKKIKSLKKKIKNPKKNLQNIFISKISKILNISKNELLKKDDFTEIEGYDSLIHLEIITQLDNIFGKKIKKIHDMSKLTSIKKIMKQLNK